MRILMRHRTRMLLGALLWAVAALSAPGLAGARPTAEAAPRNVETRAEVVNPGEFWPYDARFVRPWTPPGTERALPAGTRGVVVRVEADGRVRMDLGRDGVRNVPREVTDLDRRMEEIRSGTREKVAPNLIHALVPRTSRPGAIDVELSWQRAADETRAVLCLFADPVAEGFQALAQDLASRDRRTGLLTILLPQEGHLDRVVSSALADAGLEVPFVRATFAKGYTRALAGAAAEKPLWMLQTVDGFVLADGAWTPEGSADLAEALSRIPEEISGNDPNPGDGLDPTVVLAD